MGRHRLLPGVTATDRELHQAGLADLKAESDAALHVLRDLMQSGAPADGPVAQALAEEHRQYLTRWFYDCSYELHRGLAEMYVADERFTRTFDGVAPGLARYFHDAIVANADAHS